MTVHLSRAQAEALGILEQAAERPDPKPSRRRPRQTARGPYHTGCHYCGTEFTTKADETRHVHATRHGRYYLIFTIEDDQ